ncbi:hypothetical protein Hanom_Chr09g00813241 [Helianthus anomalus]
MVRPSSHPESNPICSTHWTELDRKRRTKLTRLNPRPDAPTTENQTLEMELEPL